MKESDMRQIYPKNRNQTTNRPPARRAGGLRIIMRCGLGLNSLDILGFRPLVTADDIKTHFFPFVQGLEARAENGSVMHKHILTRVLSNETEPLFIVEPFNFTTGHSYLLR